MSGIIERTCDGLIWSESLATALARIWWIGTVGPVVVKRGCGGLRRCGTRALDLKRDRVVRRALAWHLFSG